MRSLRLASYNIHGCMGWDRRVDKARIAAVIRELEADIVGLQEIRSSQGQSDGGQFAYLAAATGLEAIAGPTLLRSDTPCGIALLTRFPVLAVRQHDLSVPGREPRGALDVDLQVGTIRVRVLNTHLGLRTWERREQVRRLLALLPARDDQLTVLMGDINAWLPFAWPMRRLRAEFGEFPAPRTFPSWLPIGALDRIWLRPREAVTAMQVDTHQNLRTRMASDHLPLLARLTLA